MLRRKKSAKGNEVGFVADCNWSVVVQTVALCSFGPSQIRRDIFVPLHGTKLCREGVELQLRPFLTSTPNDYKRVSFIISNLMHNIVNSTNYLCIYMFRTTSAHPQEVPVVNYTIMQLLVFSFSAGSRLVHLLKAVCRIDNIVHQVGNNKGNTL
jgi:hypothetical protein